MGLILEIRKALREKPYSPRLEVSKEDYEKLKHGIVILLKDLDEKPNDYFDIQYTVRIPKDIIGEDFTPNDLIIERLKLVKEFPCHDQ